MIAISLCTWRPTLQGTTIFMHSASHSIKSKLISRISTGSNSKKRKQLVDSCVTGLQTTLQIIKDASGIAGVPGLQAGLAGLLFVIDVIKVNRYCTLRCFLTGKQKTSQNARDIEQLAII